MKCVNATWEVRNLGVRTIEISVEKKDMELSHSEILNAIENFRLEYDAQYVVVKSDTKYSSIGIELQRAGFLLIENQIALRSARKDVIKSVETYKHIFDGDVSCRTANDDDLNMIYSELKKEIFSTDRIALDPYFGKKIANRRYLLWTQDELKRGATVNLFLFHGSPAGFFLYKLDNEKKILKDTLGGLFNQFKKYSGALGASLFYAGRVNFLEKDWKFHKTFVSSNNLEALNLHIMLGSKITDIKNVLVKHFD